MEVLRDTEDHRPLAHGRSRLEGGLRGLGTREESVSLTEVDGLKIYRVPAWISLSRTPLNLAWPKLLRSIADKEQAVLLNAHGPVPGLADSAAIMKGSLPLVLTYHAGPMKKGKFVQDSAIWLYEQTLMRFTAGRSDAVICNSEYVRKVFAREFCGKSVVIPPGVDSNRFRPGSGGRPGAVLFVAQLDAGMEFKGLALLLDSIRSLTDRGVDTSLEVVGSGDLMSAYRPRAAELGLGPDRVRFSGHLTGDDLVAAYQRSSLAALPSGNESFGMFLAEAMACGLPVVASRTGGIPDVVADGETGLLVTHDDIDELTATLRVLIEDPAMAARLGSAGRKRAEVEFDWGVRAQATNDVYERVLDLDAGSRTVAILTPRYPPDMGGLERYSAQVAEGLQETGQLNPLVIATRPGLRTTYEHRHGVPVIRLGSWLKVSNTPISPMWPLQIHHLLCSRRVTLINAHAPVPVLADTGFAVSGGRPLVLTYHSGSMLKGRRFVDVWIRFYERSVLPWVLAKADEVVTVSPTTRASTREKRKDDSTRSRP